jgi:hypothetical protein
MTFLMVRNRLNVLRIREQAAGLGELHVRALPDREATESL